MDRHGLVLNLKMQPAQSQNLIFGLYKVQVVLFCMDRFVWIDIYRLWSSPKIKEAH
jgi:ABC-type uncharacterized transport system permease subunit